MDEKREIEETVTGQTAEPEAALSFEDLLNSAPETEEEYIEEEYYEEPEPIAKPVKTAKKKRKNGGTLKAIIWIIVIIAISLGFAYGIVRVIADFLGIGFDLNNGFGREGYVELTIEKGSNTTKIADQLVDAGIINCPHVFRLYSKLNHYDGQYKYGVFILKKDVGYGDLADSLMNDGYKAKTVSVQIPAASSVQEIAALMEKNHICHESDFLALSGDFALGIKNLNTIYQQRFTYTDFDYEFLKDIPKSSKYRLDGYLFPDTYEFLCHEEKEFDEMPNSVQFAYAAIDKMLGTLDEKVGDKLRKRAENSDYSFHDLVIMASVIQLEAGNASQQDACHVARVFCNRLEGVNWEGPKRLESDPTVTYANEVGNDLFNTYENEGLPPAPLGSPDVKALTAAATPKKNSDMTYFVTDKNGRFYFNNTLGAHNNTIASLKAKGLWLYTTF